MGKTEKPMPFWLAVGARASERRGQEGAVTRIESNRLRLFVGI